MARTIAGGVTLVQQVVKVTALTRAGCRGCASDVRRMYIFIADDVIIYYIFECIHFLFFILFYYYYIRCVTAIAAVVKVCFLVAAPAAIDVIVHVVCLEPSREGLRVHGVLVCYTILKIYKVIILWANYPFFDKF